MCYNDRGGSGRSAPPFRRLRGRTRTATLVAAAVVLIHSHNSGGFSALAEPLVHPAAASNEVEGKEPASPTAFCPIIESQAKLNRLPLSYFTRLIWKESRFNPSAVSPKGAQGLAQFMPKTAAERGLADPFDANQAIPHSARLLRELHVKFGNLGLAAAAYNAGPRRVTNWLNGRSALPTETLDYVLFITGRAATDWQAESMLDDPAPANKPELDLPCSDFIALTSRGLIGSPKAALQRRTSGPVIARHSGHKLMAASVRAPTSSADSSGDSAGRTIVSRLKGSSPPAYAVHAEAQDHGAARRTCSRLRASGSYCVIVIR